MEFAAIFASVVSVLVSVAALLRRQRKLSLSQIATLACDHGEAMATPSIPAWRLALEAGKRLDAGDNGKRDYSDAQIRVAIDAEVGRRAKLSS